MFDLIRTRMDLRMEDIGSRSYRANTNSHGIPLDGGGRGGVRDTKNVNSDLNHRTRLGEKSRHGCRSEG